MSASCSQRNRLRFNYLLLAMLLSYIGILNTSVVGVLTTDPLPNLSLCKFRGSKSSSTLNRIEQLADRHPVKDNGIEIWQPYDKLQGGSPYPAH